MHPGTTYNYSVPQLLCQPGSGIRREGALSHLQDQSFIQNHETSRTCALPFSSFFQSAAVCHLCWRQVVHKGLKCQRTVQGSLTENTLQGPNKRHGWIFAVRCSVAPYILHLFLALAHVHTAQWSSFHPKWFDARAGGGACQVSFQSCSSRPFVCAFSFFPAHVRHKVIQW